VPADATDLLASLEYMLARGRDPVTTFYRKLFAMDPTIAALFAGVDMDVQRRMFLEAFRHIIMNLGERSSVEPMLKRLGARHARYGARPEHYGPVGECLLETLREAAGDRWTVQLGLEWRTAIEHIAELMIGGADEDARVKSGAI